MEGDQNNVNVSNPNPNPNMGMGESQNGNSMSLIVGVVVLLAIVILGGLYFWGQRSMDESSPATPDQTTQSIQAQNASDSAASIEADLNSTNVDTLDSQINAS